MFSLFTSTTLPSVLLRGLLITLSVAIAALVTLAFSPCRHEDLEALLVIEATALPPLLLLLFGSLRRRGYALSFLRSAALCVVLLLLVPGLIHSFVLRRAYRMMRRAALDIRSIAERLEQGKATSLPSDPWGHPYVVQQTGTRYTVISYGECGQPDRYPGSPYELKATTSFCSDLVFADGLFVQFPEGTNADY